jgi:hypothetical protein
MAHSTFVYSMSHSTCNGLLQEATGLSALFQRVDDLFAAGDPQRVAAALAGMRRGLAVVGDSVQVRIISFVAQ